MMELIGCPAVAVLTCFYWVASHLVLLLRVALPRFSVIVRYGGRCVTPEGICGGFASWIQSSRDYAKRTVGMWKSERLSRAVFHCTAILEGSILCRIRVSRKLSFCAFYVAGIVSIVLILILMDGGYCSPIVEGMTVYSDGLNHSAVAFLVSYAGRPLLAFLMHCTVRLLECLFLHRFRGGSDDCVTGFAAVAGCSFYVFASCSSGVILPCTERSPLVIGGQRVVNGMTEASPFFPTFALAVDALFVLHMVFQATQVYHHWVLAELRRKPDGTSVPKGEHCSVGRCKTTPKGVSEEGRIGDGSAVLYHFPRIALFKYVQEPHYACEVAMYAVNAISICLIVYNRSLPSGGTGREIGDEFSVGSEVVPLLCATCLPPLGVLFFSLFNLAITAREHRRFWECVNARRGDGERELIPKWDLFYGVW
ncbi:hypothetical protein, conserved [Trypanosoma brucei gambiense DAL972]|uniref:Polyprenol reductase n=1 Tax=Trypanosoma brucei gambiense (strain MHOM/CI/86/DAL972) TaxID=679716 RepID=D0A619_TRYB9|nr:hypothetical protein, conserved [Trypanosoma brucei gambiense DAL972]CBH17120.1 hypothetical protein, conserved [Trypanosoma brucei gambiense DAL972]|eukprot:XP_011779384.1 hypothetical protein, conserved [Trypanosoma brucei gambiense DAL972]